MRRHILDALIIGIALGLGVSSLYAQGFRTRNARRANQPVAMAGRAQQHPSAVAATGGTLATARALSQGSGGSVPLARATTTTASRAAVAYRGQTTYEKNSGFAHTTTCTNAAGAVVPCSR